MREVRDYVPAATPTFATRIARRFQSSLDSLSDFLQGVILAVVSVIPWLPVWGVVLALAWLIARRIRPRSRTGVVADPFRAPGG